MNRLEEYNSLLGELDVTPAALGDTVSRAQMRAKNNRRARFFVLPVSSLAVLFAAFVVIVNASTAFAMICGRIPILRELAVAVAFSPSLSAAVENEYVQPINQSQTANGITMRVEYVIVDQKQLNIFYTLDSKAYTNMDVAPTISAADSTTLEGYSVSSGSYGIQNGELRQIAVDFVDKDMPDSLMLTGRVYDCGTGTASVAAPVQDALIADTEEYKEPETLSTFVFTLAFDPSFSQQGEVITLNQDFILDDQRLTATTVEVYPTHIRLNLEDEEGNTAWLQSLVYYIEDEKGRRFEQISNGITATGSPDSPMMCSHRLESTFFAGSKKLTLTITGAIWLDKDKQRIRVDLANGTADALPEGVRLEDAVREGESWLLTFSGTCRKENASYQLFGTDYYDEAGTKYAYNSWSTGMTGYWDEESQQHVETPDKFRVQFALTDYPHEIVYLCPSYTRTAIMDAPIVIKVK